MLLVGRVAAGAPALPSLDALLLEPLQVLAPELLFVLPRPPLFASILAIFQSDGQSPNSTILKLFFCTVTRLSFYLKAADTKCPNHYFEAISKISETVALPL